MGGRGTYAKGNTPEQTYKVVGYIEDVKVLEGFGKNHSLPVESHSSWAYIKLRRDGTFHEMRIYDDEHYLIKEIAYHPEPELNKGGDRNEKVLHIHEYERDNFEHRPLRLLTSEEIQLYKKYLI